MLIFLFYNRLILFVVASSSFKKTYLNGREEGDLAESGALGRWGETCQCRKENRQNERHGTEMLLILKMRFDGEGCQLVALPI